ncbi:MAG: hypothetical protein MAG581_02215 [Deltaproteobacteria bacterium]|jgi:hypothetical protein|nr:hypothetical protein [Deltaproteobacteria bacterium]
MIILLFIPRSSRGQAFQTLTGFWIPTFAGMTDFCDFHQVRIQYYSEAESSEVCTLRRALLT